jgi:glycosyltransferase involved in cell wall biosynthesis
MRVLVVSALFPPNALGGAEVSAAHLATWLAGERHEVGVLTSARRGEDELRGELVGSLRIWRLRTPHLYPANEAGAQPAWKKPIWHLQDHVDPRNRALMASVLDAFRPDFVNLHIVQGLGYNALAEIAARGLPALYFLPDLGLACIRMSMFRRGGNCARPCAACRVSSRYKQVLIGRIARIGFCSPSRANLAAVAALVPIAGRPNAVIPNANVYPRPLATWRPCDRLRLLYVGRLHASKGVALLIGAAASLAASHRLRLDIVGDGPEAARLRALYPGADWLRFHGRVDPAAVAEHMAVADLLCVPSLWRENWPGVVVQALGLGLPVLGSRIGGIPELVEPNGNGDLVPPGDRDAWVAALRRVAVSPDLLAMWRANAEAARGRFDQGALGRRILDFMVRIAAGDPQATRQRRDETEVMNSSMKGGT